MSTVPTTSITVTITETDTVVPSGQTYASLQVVNTDAAGTNTTATATLTTPGTYVATFATVAPGAGSNTITALDVTGATLGTALTLPYTTTIASQTYPQATGITVTSP
jgi:hypothetical protein